MATPSSSDPAADAASGATGLAGHGPGSAAAIQLGAAAVVLAYGVLVNRVIPSEAYVPVNLAAGCGAVLTVRALGADWRDLGLARDRMRAGLKLGGLTLIPVAAAVGIGLAIPWTREFFRDTAIVGASTVEAAYAVLLRIPFGTAMAEELLFRGALLGLFMQRHRPWVAALLSSLVFGVWHVLPTLDSLGTNPGASATQASPLLQAGAVALVVLATGAAGMFFSWLRLRSGSILAPWLTHTGFNAIGYLGSRLEGLLSK
jgi:membrane protease YdiL (CAAX protease family)